MTELTVIQTGEVVEQMSTVDAERITSRIADKLDAIADNLEQVLPLIGEALTRRAWEALGYASPTAYVSERFAGALTRLSPEVRRPVVAQLSDAGMSTRTIAPLVGKAQQTVHDDLRIGRTQVTGDRSPASPGSPDEEFSPEPGTPSPLPKSDRINGPDGKSYPRPEPKEAEPIRPRRRPIGDAARDAGWEIRKATERIEKLLADDRYPQNREQVTTHLRGHLLYVVESCQGLLDQLD